MYKELNKMISYDAFVEPANLLVGSYYAVIYTDCKMSVLYLAKVLSKKVCTSTTRYTMERVCRYKLDIANITWSSQYLHYKYVEISEELYNSFKELAKEKTALELEYINKTNQILKNNNLKLFV